jgi:peptidoglycan hydrolase CwlO-like protein
MEAVLKSLDQRVGRIEQILPTLATRDETALLAVYVRGLMEESSNTTREVTKRGEQLSSLQRNVSDLQHNVSDLQRNVSDVQQNVSDTRQEVSRLYRRIEQMAATLDRIERR